MLLFTTHVALASVDETISIAVLVGWCLIKRLDWKERRVVVKIKINRNIRRITLLTFCVVEYIIILQVQLFFFHLSFLFILFRERGRGKKISEEEERKEVE